MKSSKYTTTKRRSLRKGAVVDKNNVEVIEVGERDDEIDSDVAAEIEKRKKRSSG